MSRKLLFSFTDCALTLARQLASAGQSAAALAKLETALAGGEGELSEDATVEAHRLAAELALRGDRYGKARRHLRAALALRPDDAALHHQLGLAFQDDPYGCDRRAAKRFRTAVKLAPNSPAYRAALGLALVRLDRVKAGLRHLKQAATLAPTDAAVLTVVMAGLREADRPKLAEKWLRAARFHAPANKALERLWARTRFDVARSTQRKRRGPVGAATIPFVRVVSDATTPTAGGVIRWDAGSRTVPHFGRLGVRRG